MEFKEVKVATLTKDDKALRKKVEEASIEANYAFARVDGLHRLFWQQLRDNHNLFSSTPLFIRGNNIYKRILE